MWRGISASIRRRRCAPPTRKFERRFRHIETRTAETGKTPEGVRTLRKWTPCGTRPSAWASDAPYSAAALSVSASWPFRSAPGPGRPYRPSGGPTIACGHPDRPGAPVTSPRSWSQARPWPSAGVENDLVDTLFCAQPVFDGDQQVVPSPRPSAPKPARNRRLRWAWASRAGAPPGSAGRACSRPR